MYDHWEIHFMPSAKNRMYSIRWSGKSLTSMRKSTRRGTEPCGTRLRPFHESDTNDFINTIPWVARGISSYTWFHFMSSVLNSSTGVFKSQGFEILFTHLKRYTLLFNLITCHFVLTNYCKTTRNIYDQFRFLYRNTAKLLCSYGILELLSYQLCRMTCYK